MKKILIGCGAVLLLSFIVMGILGFVIYKSHQNFPEYAKSEVVYKKYDHLIKQIDDNIMKSDTALSLASNLEKMQLPNNLIYLALEKTKDNDDFGHNDKNIIEIIKTQDHSSRSTTIINGSGYGTIGNTKILIIDYEIEKFDDVESCIIYIKQDDDEIKE